MVKKKFETFDIVLVILQSMMIWGFFFAIETMALLFFGMGLGVSDKWTWFWALLIPVFTTIYGVKKMLQEHNYIRVFSILIGFIGSILSWHY